MSGTHPGADQPEPVGELAEEAAKLLGALGAWARDQGTDLGAVARDAADHLGAAGPTGSGPDCRWCPVCRTAHLARQVSPEVREQLGVAATALLQAGSGILASLAAAAPRGDHRPPPGPGVERIDLDDGPDDHDDHDEHPGGPR